ncbi:hypothetical protein TWF788_005188 [Orbilia oligospora]|uniref:Uncharacterized protein n=1 Tax=Orbilia oligospora TaxID=2813651 RepID=A0A7C8PZC2_ORBOL|nr:hypothetical protein TWF788_005188 [Orbilia oligospora]
MPLSTDANRTVMPHIFVLHQKIPSRVGFGNIHIRVHAPMEKHEDEDTDCCHSMSPELMERSFENLIDRIVAGAFPFIGVVGALSKNQPPTLRKIAIEVLNDSELQDTVVKSDEAPINYPRHLECIRFDLHEYERSRPPRLDPFEILIHSYDSLKVLELKVDSWDGRYGKGMVFPNLKILKVSQMSEEDHKYDPIARHLSRIFPGVEELWLDSVEVSGEASMHSMKWKSRAWVLNRFMKWSRMMKVKRVELQYVGHDDLPNDLIYFSHQHFAVAIVEELIRVWTLYGMDVLKTVHCARDEVSKDLNHNVDCTFEISRAAANMPTSMSERRRNAETLRVKLVKKNF